MSRRTMSSRTRFLLAIAATISLVATLISTVPTAAFALPPSTIVLATDRTEFTTGQTATLTATTDYAATGALPARIIDQTTGTTLKTCYSGTTCSISTFFTTGGAHTYVATVNGLTSSSVTVARTAWTIALTADRTTFATGETFTLTATANQSIGLTNYNDYKIRIYDVTAGTTIKYCGPGSGTTCTFNTVYYTGGPHTYIADIAATGATLTPAYGSQTDIQATSTQLVTSRQGWTVSLVSDKSTFATGQTFTLTATANQNFGLTNYNYYKVRIYDVTTGQTIKYCNPGAGTTCSINTVFYTGGPHTYLADVAAVGTASTYGSQTDVQAVSSEVVVSRQAWTVSLSADKTVFETGETVTLTATTNQQFALTNYNYYKVRIYDLTTGQTIKYCNVGGTTTCAITTAFYTGGPHTYVADVAAAGTANTYGSQTDVQGTSSQIVASRKAWTVSLVADKTTFETGETVTLTATTNQNFALANYNYYKVRIYDVTTGETIKYCNSGGSTTCAVTTVFYTGGPHTYVADVAAFGTANTYGSQTDVQASSSEIVATRKAWTVSLTADKTTFAAGETVTLTATTNQNFGLTNYNYYKVRIYDISTGETIKYCNPGPGTSCSVEAAFYAGGPHTYAADVAAAGAAPVYGNQTDIQATSNHVVAARKPWLVSMSAIKTITSDGLTVNISFAAATNQNVGSTGGNFQIRIVDTTNGTLVGSCTSGTTCLKSTSRAVGTAAHAYIAVVATSAGGDVQATSKGFSSDTGSGAILPGESTGGQNSSENSCQCSHVDPVNSATGEFYLPASDIGVPGAGPGLGVSRTYSSSLASTSGPFGYGWSSNFSARLEILIPGDSADPLPRHVQITQENGATVAFFEGEDQLYWAPERVLASLTRDDLTGNWTFVRKLNEVMVFDSAGRLIQLKDLHGNTVTAAYDGANQLTSLSASGGRTLTLTWTGGHVTHVADSAGRSVSYTYSGGNLTAVTAVDGKVTSYGYDSSHLMTALTKPGGAMTTNVYDSAHRVISQTDPVGRITTFGYVSDTTTITAPDGSKIVEVYSDGRLASQTLAATTALAATTSYVYDAASNVTSTTDPLGQVTTLTYDGAGNMLTKTDPLGRVNQWTYNALKKPLTNTDPLGRVTTFTYNGFGDLLTSTSPTGRVTTFTYNSDGTVATTVDAAGDVTSFSYDSAGRPVSTIDADGLESEIDYDAAGRIASETAPDGESTSKTTDPAGRVLTVTDPNGHVSTFTYDVRGNQTSVTDANGSVTTNSYDAADQLASTTDPAGKVTVYAYTPTGLLATVTDANNHTTSYTYNARGELTLETDPNGRETSYEYDAAGRTLSTTLPSGAVSSVIYDAAGQVTSSTDPNGEATLFGYDLAGQLTSTTDPLGRLTTSAYTGDGQASVVTLPDTSTQISTYTLTGQLSTFKNPDGKVTTYSYTDAGRLAGKVEPGGLTTTTAYDSGGRVDTVTLPDSSTKVFSYDDAGRVTGVHYSASGSTDTGYIYDDGGRLTGMTDATGSTTFAYDSAGRLLSEADGDGAVVSYGYDFVGQLTTITYPGNRTATYAYDAAGQMISLTDWASNTTTFDWTANGQLETQLTPNGVTQTNTYDLAGRATGISAATASGVLASFEYEYDAAGQLAGDTSTNAGSTTSHDYGYDLLNQLGAVDTTPAGGPTTSAAFDASSAGQLTDTASGETLTYNAAQQLTDLVPDSGPAVTYAYDARGSRTSSTIAASGLDPAATTEYAYTAAGALASVTTPTTTVEYTVDGRGLRQSRTVGATTDDFVWSTVSGLPLLLGDGDHAYLYGPSIMPVAQVDAAGDIEYLHGDLIGSVRALTDDSGAVVGASTFDPFGALSAHTGAVGSAFGFSGNWTDPDTGLVHLRARDYDPATGQFLSVDPAVDSTRQPYAYVGNSPLSRTDPTGLDWLNDTGDWLAGWADSLTFGATKELRKFMDVDDTINPCSEFYTWGGVGGFFTSFLIPGAGIVKVGQALEKIANASRIFSQVRSPLVQIFRTVGADEAASIVARGAYTNLPWVAGKYFFPALEQATSLATKYEALGWGTQAITSGLIPRAALIAAETISPAGEGRALYLAGDAILRQIQNVIVHGGLK